MLTEQQMEALVRQVLEQLTGEPDGNAVAVALLSVEDMVELSLGLAFSSQAKEVRQALLEGRAVQVGALESHRYRSTASPGLWRLLEAAEGRLTDLGIQIGGTPSKLKKSPHRPLITAKRAAELAQQGKTMPPNALVTPAAADYWKQLGR